MADFQNRGELKYIIWESNNEVNLWIQPLTFSLIDQNSGIRLMKGSVRIK